MKKRHSQTETIFFHWLQYIMEIFKKQAPIHVKMWHFYSVFVNWGV